MSAFKNQHFVPQVYLRSFSTDKRSINAYNINRKKYIEQASIKGQCSKDFFYGKDLTLEKVFHFPEKVLGQGLKYLHANGQFDAHWRESMKALLLTQFFRTDSHVNRLKQMEKLFASAVSDDPKHLTELGIEEPTREDILRDGLISAIRFSEMLDIFNCCIVCSNGHGEFFTSDNPAFHMNKYAHLRKLSLHSGLFHAGTMFQFPLTPCFTFLMYDRRCYSISTPRGDKVYYCKSKDDVLALNEATFFYAFKNIYFENNVREQIEFIEQESDFFRNQFGTVRSFGIPESSKDGFIKYRVVSEEEAKSAEKVLIHLSSRKPPIRRVFQPLKVRTGFRPFDTHSAAGTFPDKSIYERSKALGY